jgi:hypothetical protein
MSTTTDKSNIMRTFNSQFFSFFDDILLVIPENTEIQYAKKSFDTIKHANPSIIIKLWFKCIYTTYQKEIDEGDIRFFFEKDYSQDLTKISNAREIMNMIDKLREPIRNMDDKNKDISMKYIKVLSKLSTIYSTM